MTDLSSSAMRGYAPPVEMLVVDWLVVAGVVAAGLILAIAIVLWLRRRRGGSSIVETEALRLPASEEAMARLSTLRDSGILYGDSKVAFVEMSSIFRHYLSRRFQCPATELSSSEILSRLANRPETRHCRASIKSWMQVADLVKYASATVDSNEAELACNNLQALIHQTKEVAQEEPQEVAIA